MKYICEERDAKIYVRGKCCVDKETGELRENYSDWIVKELYVPTPNVLSDENGQPIWEVLPDDSVIKNPLPLKEQEIENRTRAAAMVEGKELNLKDENGDVRWRILPNEAGKLQIEVDPIDKPHIGEWLLNGILGMPRIEEGQLLICLDGELQGITLIELKKLLEDF